MLLCPWVSLWVGCRGGFTAGQQEVISLIAAWRFSQSAQCEPEDTRSTALLIVSSLSLSQLTLDALSVFLYKASDKSMHFEFIWPPEVTAIIHWSQTMMYVAVHEDIQRRPPSLRSVCAVCSEHEAHVCIYAAQDFILFMSTSLQNFVVYYH